MKSVADTFIYRNMNRGEVISKSIMRILSEGKVLSAKDLDEAIATINRFKFPLRSKVLDDFDTGLVKVVVPPTGVKLPTYMPFFLTKIGDNIVAVIDFSIYGNITQTGARIDAKKLYCLLESAHVARNYFINERAFIQRSTLLMKTSTAYANIFVRVLNKNYSLNLNPDRLHKVTFLAAKFCLINIMGIKDGDICTNYAMKACGSADVSTIQLMETNTIFTSEYYTDFATFIKGLSNGDLGLNLAMDDLTVRSYLESFALMYDSSMMLALESFPYLMYNLLCVMNGGYINNQKLLEQVVGAEIGKIYQDLLALER